MLENKESVKIQSVFHEIQPECLCPLCGYDCIHFDKVLKPNFSNEKSSGIILHFYCEEGHFFNIVIEDYKGNSYMTYTDEKFNIIKPVVPETTAELDELSLEILKNLKSLTPVQKARIIIMIDEMKKGA